MSSIDKTSGAGFPRSSEVQSDVEFFGSLLVQAKKLPATPRVGEGEDPALTAAIRDAEGQKTLDPEAALGEVADILPGYTRSTKERVQSVRVAALEEGEVAEPPKLSRRSTKKVVVDAEPTSTASAKTTTRLSKTASQVISSGSTSEPAVEGARNESKKRSPEHVPKNLREAEQLLRKLEDPNKMLPQSLKRQLRKLTPDQREELRAVLGIAAKSSRSIETQRGVLKTELKQSEITDKEKIAKKERFATLFSRSSEGSRLKKAGMWGGTGTLALIALGKTLEGIGTAGSKTKEGLKSFGSFIADGVSAACKKAFVREPRYVEMTTSDLADHFDL